MEQTEIPFEVAEHRARQRENQIFWVMRHAMDALSARGLRYLALLLTAGAIAWAQFDPSTGRTVNSALMAIVYVITLFKKDGGDGE